MSGEIETMSSLPAFSRPTSLYLPDVPRAMSLLDTTSYSPFPTFPGSVKQRDPYGLNAYLLHPHDSLWSYVDPIPHSDAAGDHQRSLDGSDTGPTRLKSVRKQRSLSVLRRPSPLGAQPPVSGELSQGEEVLPQQLVRRRSNSIGSSPTLSIEEAAAVIATFRDEKTLLKAPKSRKSLRKAFSKARKSVFGVTEGLNVAPPVPAMPEVPGLVAPNMSASSSEDFGPTTPLSTRSNSNYSTMSSASSTSSSEGVKTPNEGIPVEITITGSKLANALQEAGGSKKGKTWSRWLGGKKGKLGNKEGTVSGAITPVSDSSASSTPNSSSPDLLSGDLPKVTLTPSPAIVTPPGKTTLLIPSLEQMGRQNTFVTEQLRRISVRKMNMLKAPSPHPLAMTLRRQHSRLPEEVASHIQAGQRVFPVSVNWYQGTDGDLVPAQGGLWVGMAISQVMVKLDQGQQPEGTMRAKKGSKRTIVPRPRGVHDFISRPPYEERNMVFYSNNVFSPISMARPGHGVWDLDFSHYILALSEIDDPPASWPAFPRASVGVTDNLAQMINAVIEVKIADEQIEVLASPTLKEFAKTSEAPLEALAVPIEDKASPVPSITSTREASPCPSPKSTPLSSFRHLSALRRNEVDYSSDEESSQESDEDNEPLARLAKKRSSSFQLQSSSSPSKILARPGQGHIRSLSQPEKQQNASRRLSVNAVTCRGEASQQHAMEQVARARERREQNLLGEAEKRAESDQMRQMAKKRLSLANLKATASLLASSAPQHRRTISGDESSDSPSRSPIGVRIPGVHISQAPPQQFPSRTVRDHDPHRRRIVSGLSVPSMEGSSNRHLSVSRPEAQRGRSAPGQLSRRYHSFYEQQSASVSAPSFNVHPRPQSHHRLSQQFVFPLQTHVMPLSQQNYRHSMLLPQQMMMPMYPPPHHHPQAMFAYPSISSADGSVNKRASRMS